MNRIVAVTQPYVPAYRVPLFDALSMELAPRDLELRVYSARPTGMQAKRGDNSSGPWHEEISSRDFKVGRWTIQHRRAPEAMRDAAILISELEALNMTAWRDVFRKRPTVLWGHGKGFVNDTGNVSDFVESQLASRADHIMTYSPSGRQFLVQSGRVDPGRVTAIGNSTDTATLRSATEAELAKTATREGGPKHALYVGGLDQSKRIGFLIDAYEAGLRVDPELRLTVVGRGEDEALVREKSKKHSGLRYVPEARGADLARLGVEADAMWIPGRVGLVAVDALAMGLPVHTTQYPYHAPEIEFLGDSEVAFLGPDAAQFADESLALMSSAQGKTLRPDIPTIESVARNMASVVFHVLGKD